MFFDSWFTDSAVVERVTQTTENNITRNARATVYNGIPCRVYNDSAPTPAPTPTASNLQASLKAAFPEGYEIHPGDEITITRGGAIGKDAGTIIANAGAVHTLYDPVGSVLTALNHTEVALLERTRP